MYLSVYHFSGQALLRLLTWNYCLLLHFSYLIQIYHPVTPSALYCHHIFCQFRCSVMSDSLGPHGWQHTGPSCPSPTPGACSNLCPSSQWCRLTIPSSVVPFSSRLQSFPASGSFPMSQFFPSRGQNTGVSASTWVLPMNIQDWFPLGLTDWISLQSKGLWRVFSNTTIQKHQFFSAQLSSPSNSHIHTWLLEKS